MALSTSKERAFLPQRPADALLSGSKRPSPANGVRTNYHLRLQGVPTGLERR